MPTQERSAEDVTCLVLLEHITATADATRKMNPPDAATALNRLAAAYVLLVNQPYGQDGMPLGDSPTSVEGPPP
ncbi:hypothetical protein [Streptomyces spinosus]|uniref:hypothetical protein n=1 Tax=Streptomyces spinosus TaxID=2872623 RepID=UPI001CED1183|nr:hypothetical protein [Streptomyces spinosus]